MNNPKIVGTIVMAIIIAMGSFWGGMQYQKNRTPIATERAGGQGFRGQGQGRGGSIGGFVSGTVLSKDATSITIKMPQGGTRIVLYSSSTQVGKAVQGIPSDLAVGQTVSAQGTSNSDGSLSAESIQIRPPAGQGFGRSATSSRP